MAPSPVANKPHCLPLSNSGGSTPRASAILRTFSIREPLLASRSRRPMWSRWSPVSLASSAREINFPSLRCFSLLPSIFMEPIVGIPVLSEWTSTDSPILERRRKPAKFLRGITKKCLDFTEAFFYPAPIRKGHKGAAVNNPSAKGNLTTAATGMDATTCRCGWPRRTRRRFLQGKPERGS